MLDQPLRHDLGHDLIGAVRPLSAVKAECEGERRGEIVGGSEREAVGGQGHAPTIAASLEHNKNTDDRPGPGPDGPVNARGARRSAPLIAQSLDQGPVARPLGGGEKGSVDDVALGVAAANAKGLEPHRENGVDRASPVP